MSLRHEVSLKPLLVSAHEVKAKTVVQRFRIHDMRHPPLFPWWCKGSTHLRGDNFHSKIEAHGGEISLLGG